MKLTDQDIIRTAQLLRNEHNQSLHVRPWHRLHRFNVPSWLIAVPAAAFLGFVVGVFCSRQLSGDEPVAMLTDTVYVQPPTPAVTPITTAAPSTPVVVAPCRPIAVHNCHSSNRLAAPSATTGRSVADDHIRYDLLVQ